MKDGGACGVSGEAVPAHEAQQLLFCEGAAAATSPDISKGRWMMYRSADNVKQLMTWLHGNGERERTLKARLKQACRSALPTSSEFTSQS